MERQAQRSASFLKGHSRFRCDGAYTEAGELVAKSYGAGLTDKIFLTQIVRVQGVAAGGNVDLRFQHSAAESQSSVQKRAAALVESSKSLRCRNGCTRL
jgi:hypothetical protein